MHILIPVLHRPSKPTGVCRHAVNLAQCLAEIKLITKVTLIIGAWQQEYFANSFDLSSSKIELVSIAIANSSISRNKWFLFDLPKMANRLQPDLVHLSFPIPFIRQKFAAPVVATVHDLYPFECPDNFGYPGVWFNQWFLKQCVRHSDGLCGVSQSTLESLKHYFPQIDRQKQVSLIYNYVDFGDVTPQIPQMLRAEQDLSFVLCVAQHRQNKNLDLLIKSYAELLEQGFFTPATKLILVGNSGPESEKINHLIETLNLQLQVILMSSLSDGELCWLYKNCEVFIIPSSTEGFCLPLVEAITLAKRVVCSDIPVFREVGSTDCCYFDLQDRPVQNLSEATISAFSDRHTSSVDREVRFSKEYIAQQILDFYSSILNRGINQSLLLV